MDGYTTKAMRLYELEQPSIRWWELDDDYPIIQHVGNAIGATRYALWNKVGAPWGGSEMIGGSGGYLLDMSDNTVLMDASPLKLRNGTTAIILSQILIREKGQGLGSTIMNALKEYADTKQMPLMVWKATIRGRKFFDSIDWLENVDVGEYQYNPQTTT